MNAELINSLGIKSSHDLRTMLEELENKQFEYLERMETVSDEARKDELAGVLKLIDIEIDDIKAQLKAVSSSIILDTSEKADEPMKTVSNEELKKEQVSQKVEALKAKETERQKELAEKVAKEISRGANSERTSQDIPNVTASGIQNASQTVDVLNADPEYVKGLFDYKNGNFSAAFNTLKVLAEKDNAQAQYLIAHMYYDGKGVTQDIERAEFWMKKSADLGETFAELDYGILLLSSNEGDNKRIAEGVRYLELAADKGETSAMLKYIEVAKKQVTKRKVVDKAIVYCSNLKTNANDSFDIKQYDELEKELVELRRDAIRLDKKIKRASTFSILGAVFCLIASIYIFGGIHDYIWELHPILELFSKVKSILIVRMGWCWERLSKIMNSNGAFGLELFTIGWMLREAGDNDLRSKFSKVIDKMVGYFKYPLIIGHFYSLIVIEEESFFKALGWYIIVLLIAMFIGTILGFIWEKIFKTK